MPRPLPPVSRRRVLVGAAALAVLGVSATACSEAAPDSAVETLAGQLDRARFDSDLASAAATTAPPQLGGVLTTIAAERAAHARALSDEVTRLLGTTPTTTSSTPTTTTAAAPKAVTTGDVVSSLRGSAKSAGELAAQQSGYRAGLLGSIAAACTAAAVVPLGGEDDA